MIWSPEQALYIYRTQDARQDKMSCLIIGYRLKSGYAEMSVVSDQKFKAQTAHKNPRPLRLSGREGDLNKTGGGRSLAKPVSVSN